MQVGLQSLPPCDFSEAEVEAVCYAINRFGNGQHPMATAEELTAFGFRYVIRCTSQLAASTTHERVWTDAALAALDKIKSQIILGRAERLRSYANPNDPMWTDPEANR